MLTWLDWTTASLWLSCRKKFYWRIVEELVPKQPSGALAFGAAIHSGLEELYGQWNVEEAQKAFEESWLASGVKEDEKRNLQRGQLILKGYAEKYIGLAELPFKVIKTEHSYCLDMPGCSVKAAGRIDKVIEWDGLLLVLDHKTASQVPATYWERFKLHKQMLGYCWAASKESGEQCAGFVIDAVGVFKDKLLFSMDNPITVMPEQVKGYEVWFRAVAEDITNAFRNFEETGCKVDEVFYEGSACNDYSGCAYKDLCVAPADAKDWVVDNMYGKEKWSYEREDNK